MALVLLTNLIFLFYREKKKKKIKKLKLKRKTDDVNVAQRNNGFKHYSLE